MLVVVLNAAGDDVESVRVVSQLLNGTTPFGATVEKTFTKAEAAGVTAAQLSAFLAAADTLRTNHQAALFGS